MSGSSYLVIGRLMPLGTLETVNLGCYLVIGFAT